MKSLIFFVFIISSWIGTCQSNAQEVFAFGPKQTKMIGSITYTVIGQYKAQFSVFKGRITLDERSQQVVSVYLEIEANSIKSNHPWCDRLARSRRLLYTAKYPKIIFKSDEITRYEGGYKVRGILEMRGLKRRMTFPFHAETINDERTQRKLLDLKGSWSINRKDFDIVWNRYLDRGGVLVGDYFTVDWGIKVLIPDSR